MFPESHLDRMELAQQMVFDRRDKVVRLLDALGICYAVIGGHAVAAWVESHGEGGVRMTPDIDLLINRLDFPAIEGALSSNGFTFHRERRLDMFLDTARPKVREAVHLTYAGESIAQDKSLLAPVLDPKQIVRLENRPTIALEPLVRLKLSTNRLHDKVHVRDMLDVGLIDANWVSRFEVPLAGRLQHLIDTPDG